MAERIANSIVINLAVRKRCHDALGGFPDYHLFRRVDERLVPEADVFYKVEDMFYNRLLGQLCRGRRLAEETVEYCRHPGNAYDRQYEKFRRPPGEYSENQLPDERFRLRVGEVILERMLPQLDKECRRRLGRAEGTSPVLEAARRAQQASDFAQAERLSRQLLGAEPRNADAWHSLGLALQGRGELPQASDAHRRALEIRPDRADSHYQLGLALAGQGQRPQAAAHFRQAVQLQPAHAEALAHLGLVLAEQGRRGEAISYFQQALLLRPESAPTYHNLGVALAQEQRLPEAVESLEKSLQFQPDYVEACYALGCVFQQQGRRVDAIARFRDCLKVQPGHAGACNNLGLALTEERSPHEAVVLLQQATRLQPQMKEAHNNLGLAYTDLGRFAEAEASFGRALALDPAYAEGHANLGNAYKEQGQLEEALACYEHALRLAPQTVSSRYNRSLALLQKGDYEQGWPEYEWRWRRPQTPSRPFQKPRWDGAAGEGKTVLLWCEQGLGDAIQFVRYASLVKQRVGRVILECPPMLVPLFSSCPGVDQAVAEGQPLPDFDAQAPLLSLPALCGTTLANVPAEVPYMRVEPSRIDGWRARLPGVEGLRVGVVWQGNPRHGWDRHRSAPLACLEPLARQPGVRLVSLQKGPGREQIEAMARRFEVLDLGGELDESGGAFVDTAAVMQVLDLVVTVDTAAAHVAGALGVPVWLALSRIADWRWMCARDDTPWYPSMRLFRQERLGDWNTVFARMANQLRELLKARPKSRIAVGMAPGELIDRLTILEIKGERLIDPDKRAVVRQELDALRRARDEDITPSGELTRLTEELRSVNEGLWDSEDRLRLCERRGDFGSEFIGLARSVYLQNDQRAALKQRINALLGAPEAEPKAYPDYGSEPASLLVKGESRGGSPSHLLSQEGAGREWPGAERKHVNGIPISAATARE